MALQGRRHGPVGRGGLLPPGPHALGSRPTGLDGHSSPTAMPVDPTAAGWRGKREPNWRRKRRREEQRDASSTL